MAILKQITRIVNSISRMLLAKIDLKLCAAILVLSTLLMAYGAARQLSYLLMGVLLFASSFIWMVARKRLNPHSNGRQNKLMFKSLLVLYFLVYTIALIIFQTRPDAYERPLSFLILLSLLASLILLEVLFTGTERSFVIVLAQIILFSILICVSIYTLYPSLLGVDTTWHDYFTSRILANGFIPENQLYSDLPIFDLLIGTTQLLLGVDYKSASFLSISLAVIICDSLMLFLIARKVVDSPKVGLFAPLFIAVYGLSIYFLVAQIPTALAVTFILFVVYLLLISLKYNLSSVKVLLVLFSVTIVFTHTLMAMILAIIFLCVLVSNCVSRLEGGENDQIKLRYTYFLLFSVMAISWWSFVSGHMSLVTQLIASGFNSDFFAPGSSESSQYYAGLDSIESLLMSASMSVFAAISFLGIFYMLSKRGDSKAKFVAIAPLVLIVIAYISTIFQLPIVPERWFYIGIIMLSIPIGVTISMFVKHSKRKLFSAVKFVAVFAVFFTIAFFSLTSSTANMDNPTISPNTTVRKALTDSELSAFYFFADNWNGAIGGDKYYTYSYMGAYPFNTRNLDKEIQSGKFSDFKGVALIRTEIECNPFILGGGPYAISYDIEQRLESGPFNKVYCSSGVVGYQSYLR